MASVIKNSKLRYIEISRRNPVTRIYVGNNTMCGPKGPPACGDFCLEITRSGTEKCSPPVCEVQLCCTPPKHVPNCSAAKVYPLERDAEGYLVFEWPSELFTFQHGWYDAQLVLNKCEVVAVLPLRIGERANVIEVERVVSGPDYACAVPCEDDGCGYDTCPDTSPKPSNSFYIPPYEVT